MQPLLSNKEIIRFSGITPQFPTCELRNIFQTELTEFNLCLGSAFKKALDLYLADYSTVQPYDISLMYSEDDVVSYDGDIYVCIASAAASEKPPLYTKWKLAPKFILACVDDFWCTFLGEYLSLSVIINKLPSIRTQITAEGAIMRIGEHFNPASDKAYTELYGSYLGRKDDLFLNLKRFVKQTIKEGTSDCVDLFNTFKFIGNSCCSDCGECFDDCLCDDSCSDTRLLYEVG